MKILALLIIALSGIFSSCSLFENKQEDTAEEIVLSEEVETFQKVSFASESLSYLYDFSYNEAELTYLGYPLEGMSENGGAFVTHNGVEIVTSTDSIEAVGVKTMLGNKEILLSSETKDECFYDFIVLETDFEPLQFRIKACSEESFEEAFFITAKLIETLSINAL